MDWLSNWEIEGMTWSVGTLQGDGVRREGNWGGSLVGYQGRGGCEVGPGRPGSCGIQEQALGYRVGGVINGHISTPTPFPMSYLSAF